MTVGFICTLYVRNYTFLIVVIQTLLHVDFRTKISGPRNYTISITTFHEVIRCNEIFNIHICTLTSPEFN